jgi:hypothetical protein
MTSTGRLRALRGKRLRDLVEEGVRRVLGTPDPERSPSRVSFPLIDSKRPGSLSVEAVRRAEAETFSTRTTIVAALCDVNLLLALVIDKHTHHAAAVGWLQGKAAGEARICRLTQIGLLRLLNSPAVMQDDVLDTVGSWEVWYRLSRPCLFSLCLDGTNRTRHRVRAIYRVATVHPLPMDGCVSGCVRLCHASHARDIGPRVRALSRTAVRDPLIRPRSPALYTFRPSCRLGKGARCTCAPCPSTWPPRVKDRPQPPQRSV